MESCANGRQTLTTLRVYFGSIEPKLIRSSVAAKINVPAMDIAGLQLLEPTDLVDSTLGPPELARSEKARLIEGSREAATSAISADFGLRPCARANNG